MSFVRQNKEVPAPEISSSLSSAYGFFSKSILSPIYKKLGGHFPYHSYLGGHPIIGKLWHVFSKDGRGLDKIIMEAAPLAEQNDGVAWWRFRPLIAPMQDAILVTRPDDIKEILKDNIDNLILHDSTGSFKMFFGENSIFNLAYGSEKWRQTRNKFLHFLFTEKALNGDVQLIQKIIKEHLSRLNNGKIANLEAFTNSITLDMIGRTKLGFAKIDEDAKAKVSEIIAKAIVEVANPWNQAIAPYLPGYKFANTRLAGLLREGWAMLREKIIRPNRGNILFTENWLTHKEIKSTAEMEEVKEENKAAAANESIPPKDVIDLDSEEIIYDIIQFLVAGHETSAKLLLLSLMLLGDSQHAHILEKIRAEMASLGKEPEEWVRDDIKKLVYLEAFINEVLRLYPPIPDMIFTAKKAFSTGNGKYNFKPGDMIIISQRITGRLTIAWGDDAEECKPERFYNEETKEKNVDEMLEFKFFPFGIKQRQCVGRNFSKQEVALIIGHIITKFDLQLKSKEGQDLHHPFPFHQVFTLRMGLEDINLHLKPREVPKVDSQQSMPLPQQFFNFKVGSHDFNLKLTLPNESVVLPAVQCEASRSLKHTS